MAHIPDIQGCLAEGAVPWNSIVWATVVIVFFILFRTEIARFVGRVARLNVSAGKSGVQISFDASKAESELFRAVEAKGLQTTNGAPAGELQIARTVMEAAPREEADRFARAEILWVDDNPKHNIHERRAFEAIGLRFTLRTSTDAALEILSRRSFRAVISDMGRPPDERAGYTLLDALRGRGDRTPFFIYAGSCSLEHRRETTMHQGQGCTNRPDELFQMVTGAVIAGHAIELPSGR